MTASEASLEGYLQSALDDMPEIVATVFNALAFNSININGRFRQATARERAVEQYGSDRWDFEYRILVRWKKVAPDNGGNAQIKITVIVTEQQYNHQEHECEDRCDLVMKELKEHAFTASSVVSEPSTTYGSAKWATVEELEKGGYFDEITSGRLILGRYKGRVISVPKNLTEEHALVCGPTGSGKTRTIFIPNLVKRLATSALVTEAASGDEEPSLYSKTAGWRAAAGHTIHYFNPSDLTSTRINPLDSVQTFDDANHISSLIIRNTKQPFSFGGDQVWEQSETHLLNSLILYVIGLREGDVAKPGDNANLAYIRNLLRDGPAEIGKIIQTSRIELAQKEFNSFLKNTSPNFRFGVTSGLLVRLNPWVNKRVAALTEVTDFHVDALKNQLFTFYFAISTKKPHLRPVAALAFNYVFDLIQSPGFSYPLTLLLDELTNYGYIPELPDKLTHIRHQKIGAVLGIQHTVQLSKVYHDKDAVLLNTQPGTRIFFRPRDNYSAEMISKSLGNSTIKIRKVTPNGGVHEDERSRPLMDSSEILRLPKANTVSLTPTTNPLILDMFHPIEHDEFTKEPAPFRPSRYVDERLVKMCANAETNPEWKQKADREVHQYKSQFQNRQSEATQIRPHESPLRSDDPLGANEEFWSEYERPGQQGDSSWDLDERDDRADPDKW